MPRARRSAPWELLGARPVVILILHVPLVVGTYRYLVGSAFYGEFLHWTGDQAARLLIVVLAVTPLRMLWPRARWTRWLLLRRRDIGVATFNYALLHTVVYLAYKKEAQAIIQEGLELGMLVGWLAMLILVPLAMTSNNVSIRVMGGGWKTLHRGIYAAAALTFAHWVLTAFDPAAAYVHLGVLIALTALRFLPKPLRR